MLPLMGPFAHPSAICDFGYTNLPDIFEKHKATTGGAVNLHKHPRIVLVTAST
jgi:hypothetical protein